MSKKSARAKLALIFLIMLLAAAAAFFIISGVSQQSEAPRSVSLKVTVIDVGQGDSILVTSGRDAMLIDAAEKKKDAAVINELKKQNVDDIDVLVATHPHSDHIGGICDVIDNYGVGEIYMPDAAADTKTYRDMMSDIRKHDIPVIYAYAGMRFSFGNAECTIVSPQKGAHTDANNMSVAILLDFYDTGFLFTGDMEQKAEKALLSSGYDIDADVLKVAHHGSSTGTTDAFLRAVSPAYAAISCGAANTYGHPHKETLDLLDRYNVKYWRTDISGGITFVSDGKSVSVSAER